MWVVHGLGLTCAFAAEVVKEWKTPEGDWEIPATLLTFTLVIVPYFTYAVNFWHKSINQ